MLMLTFSDGSVLNLNANQSLVTVTSKPTPSQSEPFTLEPNANGLHVSLMEVLANSDYFRKADEEDVFYSSSSVVRIKEV